MKYLNHITAPAHPHATDVVEFRSMSFLNVNGEKKRIKSKEENKAVYTTASVANVWQGKYTFFFINTYFFGLPIFVLRDIHLNEFTILQWPLC